MNVKERKEGEKAIVSVSGRIDTATAPTLLEYLKTELVGVKELILDFQEVEYVSSAGLRVILYAQKTMSTQGSMKLINVSPDILEVLELTGFTEVLDIAQ